MSRFRGSFLFALPLYLLPGALFGQDTRSPYSDFIDRPIKALSAEETQSLLAGDGMGFAIAAELNGYPGPRHVLDLADSLKLSPDQRARVQSVYDRMNSHAIELGRALVRLEGVLDHVFASRTVSPDTLTALTSQIATRRGELRAAHLLAHLEVDDILSRAQAMEYQRLRGYGHSGHAHPGGHR